MKHRIQLGLKWLGAVCALVAALGIAAPFLGADRYAEQIRTSLENTIKEFKGVGGIFTFSPQKHWGLAKSDVVMIEWRQGKFRLVDL